MLHRTLDRPLSEDRNASLPTCSDTDGALASARRVFEADERLRLDAISQIITLAPHSLLYAKKNEAKFIYKIIEGSVATYDYDADGRRYITAFLFPDSLAGLSTNGRYVTYAKTLTTLRAYKIPSQDFARLVRSDSRVSVRLILKFCNDLRDSQSHSVVLAHHAAHRRLASFLLWFSDTQAVRISDIRQRNKRGDTLSLPMSRRDIADYLGLSVESISRALQLLEIDGAVRRKGARVIEIVDRKKLRRLSAYL